MPMIAVFFSVFVSFPLKNFDFLVNNVDFLLNNLDFLLNNVDFLLKGLNSQRPGAGWCVFNIEMKILQQKMKIIPLKYDFGATRDGSRPGIRDWKSAFVY